MTRNFLEQEQRCAFRHTQGRGKAFALIGLALTCGVACGDAGSGAMPDAEGSSEVAGAEQETALHDESNAESLPAGVSRQLFRDPSTSGPRLDVFDADGNIAIFVSGPIGTENDVLPGLRADSSLVELYEALHPGGLDVPSDLEALDELVAPSLRDLVASAPTEAPAPTFVDKTQSQFNSTVCKIFDENASRYTPVECQWVAKANIVRLTQGFTIRPGDRAYGWNSASNEAVIKFFPCSSCTATGTVNLPPFWWTWGSMNSGGPYTANIVAKVASTSPDGERGITRHALSFNIR